MIDRPAFDFVVFPVADGVDKDDGGTFLAGFQIRRRINVNRQRAQIRNLIADFDVSGRGRIVNDAPTRRIKR